MPAVRALGVANVWLREGGSLVVCAALARTRRSSAPSRPRRRSGAGAGGGARPARSRKARPSPVFRSGVYFPDGATVHPGLLVRALRRNAIDAGVSCTSELLRSVSATAKSRPATECSVRRRSCSRRTPRDRLAPRCAEPDELRLVRRPDRARPELLEQINWTGGEAIVDGRMFIHYFRTLDDGRVLMGAAPARSASAASRRSVQPRPALRATRRGRPPAPLARTRRGAHRAVVGRADRRLRRPSPVLRDEARHATALRRGYSGHGVGPSWLGGQILASLATRADDEWTQLPLATRRVPTLPPEPFRRLGGGLVRSAIMACEAAEENRRAPLPLDSAPLSRDCSDGDRYALEG